MSRGIEQGRWTVGGLVAVVMGVAAVVAGCGEPLQHGLEEAEANAMVAALDRHGIDADKIRDPDEDGQWAVEVPTEQRVEAWTILEREGFPRSDHGGFEDFYPGGGLIPTAKEERIVYQYATAQELEGSLLRLDRVVDADVHLVLPEEPRVQMADDDGSEPRASVLVQWTSRGGQEAPIGKSEIRQLVSGAVEDLAPEAVHVVMTPVTTRVDDESDGPRFVQVGPVAVAPRSAGVVRGLVLTMGAVIIVLASGLVYLVLKYRVGPDGGESS